MNNKEYKHLKQIVSKEDRINIINLLNRTIENKDNYFSNIIYLRKKLTHEQKTIIFNYCKEKLDYSETLETLFKVYDRESSEKTNKHDKTTFAKRVGIAIAKEKYFHNRTLEDIVKDSENTDYYFSISTLNNYKSGKSEPSYSNLEKLAKCINVIPQYLKEDDKYMVDYDFLPLDYNDKDKIDSLHQSLKRSKKQFDFFNSIKDYFITFHKEYNYPLLDEFQQYIKSLKMDYLLTDILAQLEEDFYTNYGIDKSQELSSDIPMYTIGGIVSFTNKDTNTYIENLQFDYKSTQLNHWLIEYDYEDYTYNDGFYISNSKQERIEELEKKMKNIDSKIQKEKEYLNDLQDKIDRGEIETVVFNNAEEIEEYLKNRK